MDLALRDDSAAMDRRLGGQQLLVAVITPCSKPRSILARDAAQRRGRQAAQSWHLWTGSSCRLGVGRSRETRFCSTSAQEVSVPAGNRQMRWATDPLL